MSLSSVDSEAYYTDSSSITSNSPSIASSILSSNSSGVVDDNIPLDNNIFHTPFDKNADTWFQTEDNLSLTSYIKKLFTIARNNLSCNVEANTTKAILVPHAGIRYSGLCAASAYYELTNRTRPIKNVILLCNSHRDFNVNARNSSGDSMGNGVLNIMAPRFNKISTSKKGKYLAVDTQFISKLKHLVKMDNPINTLDAVENTYFQQEHAFFNQIPFLEQVAPNASICPLLIGNILLDSNSTNAGLLDTHSLKNTLARLQLLINLLKDKLAKGDTVLICSSDFSHINGHFDTKITSNIFQNIRKLDNETLQFLYNIVDSNESRNRIIDTVLFMQNSTTCGIMAIYLFGKVLNAMQLSYRSSRSSSSSDSGSELSIKSINRYMNRNLNKTKNNDKNNNTERAYYSRVSCYYSSITREFIDLSNTGKFDNKTLVPLYEICNTNKPSVSYVGLIFTKQSYIQPKQTRKIANMLTQYEELALLGLAREQLFYHLMKANSKISIPTNLIKPINALAFGLELGVFTTLRYQGSGELRGCLGTLETGNDEFNIESNVKKYVIEAAIHDSRFSPIELTEFHKLNISITVLYELAPITINQYYTDKFALGRDGILMKLGQKQGYFLPSVAMDLGLKSGEKNKLLDELCRSKVAGCDTKMAFRKYSNTQLFYNEGLEFHF